MTTKTKTLPRIIAASAFLAASLLAAPAFAQVGSPVNIRDASTNAKAAVGAAGLKVDASGATVPVSFSQADVTGAPVALNAGNAAASVVNAGEQGAGVLIAAGTLTGTVVPEVSYDGGTTWEASQFYNPTTLALTTSIVFSNPNAATMLSIMTGGGVTHARVRVSAFTSGTATATCKATYMFTPVETVQGTVTLGAGSAVIGHAILDTTSTTAVTQATGTNLHAVLDTTSTTAVTQATGTNLHAVTDTGSTTAVTGNVAITAASLPLPTAPSVSPASGQLTVTSSAVAFGSNTGLHQACVKSDNANGTVFYVGASGVTTGTGWALYPGDLHCWQVNNTNLLFVINASGSPLAYVTGS